MRKTWWNWIKNKENSQGLVAIFTIALVFFTVILVCITGYYAWQTHETVLLMGQNTHYTNKSVSLMEQSVELMKEDIRARNRPYLQIGNPEFELYDKDGNKLNKKEDINPNQAITYEIVVKVENFGSVPAELTEREFMFLINGLPTNCSPLNGSITIYKEKHFELGSLNTSDGGKIPEMEADLKIKYKIHGTDNIFEAYTKSKCTHDIKGEKKIRMGSCFTLESHTT